MSTKSRHIFGAKSSVQPFLQGHVGASELLPLKEELDRATNSEQIRWKRSQLCIKKVAEGLRDMPQLDATTASALTSQVK